MRFYPFYLCLALAIITTSCEKEDITTSESSVENFRDFEKLNETETVQISPSNFEVDEPASFFVPTAINDEITFTSVVENDEILLKAFVPSSIASTFNVSFGFSNPSSISTELEINGVSLISRFIFNGSVVSTSIKLLIDRTVEVLANGDSIITFRLKAANGTAVTGQEIQSFTGEFLLTLRSKISQSGPTNGGGSGGALFLDQILEFNL
ncbi:hypothetical protein [Aquimarina sp. RZ0]|uniref:hypothetical protein n=1 Tax=Aquimarina sp. RZ0 TaxID=2607730 RepID=UPI0011F11AB6|nr:hypothetical protein [Aquimarina sp. RZ0]KAA1244384.1 hypothetical protein F0000_16745 [Aquimarina sp. RZ0]